MTPKDFLTAADFIRRYIAAVESHLFRARGIKWAYSEMEAADNIIKLLEKEAELANKVSTLTKSSLDPGP